VYAESIVDSVWDTLLVLDGNLRVIMANHSFYTLFISAKEETESRSLFELADRKLDIPALRKLLEAIVNKDTSFEDFAVKFELPHIGRKKMLLNGHRVVSPRSDIQMILLAMVDISKSKPGKKVLES
jgi:nitrogen-specific signal transduction histidine kinase